MRWLFLWLLGALVVGLSGGQASAQGARPWPTQYGGEDPSARFGPSEQRAFKALEAAMARGGATPCRSSARLTKAARAHARDLIIRRTSRQITPRVVRREVLRAGAVDPVVIPWAMAFTGALDLESRLDHLEARFGRRPPTHCGVGVAAGEGRQVLVIVGVRRHLELDPFPAQLGRGDRVRVEGDLEPLLRAPSVMVTTPTGEVIEHQTLRRAGRFGAWLDFTFPGRYVVEVMATGAQGPQIVALFPVFVDAAPSVEPEEAPARARRAAGGEASREAVMLRLLNDERRRAGLLPLEEDEQLSQLALAHSIDMVRRRYFAHLSPSGDDLTERLRLAGITAHRATENLARATTVERMHTQLMESPSHRVNLMDPDVSHVGLGLAEREGELVVTQIFVGW